jgi:hypothetical protein
VEEADVFLSRPAPSTLFLGGWPTTTVPLWAGTAKVGHLPVGGSVGGTRSSVLHLLALHATALSCRGLGPSPHQRGAREEVFWSLAVSTVVLLMRRLLMRVFSVAWVVGSPLG